MVAATRPKLMTVDELAAMPDGDLFELERGHLVERAMNPISAFVSGKIYRKFDEYCDRNQSVIAFPDGAGFTLRPEESDLLRKPDVSVVLKGRLPDGRIPNARFDFSPDLAVELLSPSDIAFEVETKIQEYLDAGSKLVWLAKPQGRRIVVHRPNGTEQSFGPNDEITAEEVLPGFRMRVGDVFP